MYVLSKQFCDTRMVLKLFIMNVACVFTQIYIPPSLPCEISIGRGTRAPHHCQHSLWLSVSVYRTW